MQSPHPYCGLPAEGLRQCQNLLRQNLLRQNLSGNDIHEVRAPARRGSDFETGLARRPGGQATLLLDRRYLRGPKVP